MTITVLSKQVIEDRVASALARSASSWAAPRSRWSR